MHGSTLIALLRAINLGGHNRVPMADLRALCAELGWADVRTYIQSGNVVFRAEHGAGEAEARLEDAVGRRFGLAVPVIARAAEDWSGYVETNPFPEASREQPNRVMLALSKTEPLAGAEEALRARARGGERVARVGDGIWIRFDAGVRNSKLAPSLLDRVVGSPVTTRNWRTVVALDEMARQPAG